MSFGDFNYMPADHVEAGNYRCILLSAETAVSRSQKDMIVLTLRPSGTTINVKDYLVEGPYFNRNLSRFLDAFSEISKTDLDPNNCYTWAGYLGAARLEPDENGYLKVKRYLSPERAQDLPPFVWKPKDGEPREMPTPQKLMAIPQEVTIPDASEEEFPF